MTEHKIDLKMPTADEIAARISARTADDFLGFEIGNYVECLPFDAAKEYLRDGVTADQWKPMTSAEAVRDKLVEYMPFAWDKANNCRGLSASRSISHCIAWTWLMGDEAFSDHLHNASYEHYGKELLVEVCERYGVDWRALDDGQWRRREDGPSSLADAVMASWPRFADA